MSDALKQALAWLSGAFSGGVAFFADINWLVVFAALAPLSATINQLHAIWRRQKREERLAMAEIDEITRGE